MAKTLNNGIDSQLSIIEHGHDSLCAEVKEHITNIWKGVISGNASVSEFLEAGTHVSIVLGLAMITYIFVT